MKKTFYGIAAAFAVLAMASCGGNNSKGSCDSAACEGDSCCDNCEKVFVGEIPSADGGAYNTTLTLNYDKEADCTKGAYKLDETVQKGDSTYNFNYAGDFTVTEKEGKKVYTLVQDSTAGKDTRYYILDNDSTLTQVNAELQRAASDLNYSLTLKK